MLLLLATAGCDRGDPNAVLTPDPKAREQLIHWSRPPGGTWTPDAQPVAWNFSSLHGAVIDGEIVLVGHDRSHVITKMEERFPRFFIDALVSSDGKTWAGRRYWGEGGIGGVDPAMAEDGQGWAAWVAYTATTDGDPGDPSKTLQLLRAPMDGKSLGTPVPWGTFRNAFDPAPVFFQGQLHVYCTSQARLIVEAREDGSMTTVWEGASVPFARVKGDELQLIAQTTIPGEVVKHKIVHNGEWVEMTDHKEDRRVPSMRTSKDAVTWSEPTVLLDDPRVGSCTAPVLLDFGGLEHLFCIHERTI